jgi:WD40 repeat protein
VAYSVDVLDGKIVVGHDNGKIITVNVDGTNQQIVNTSHHDGESWGLETIPSTGTFLTCGDDNTFHEFSIKERRLIKSGKIFTLENNEGRPYQTNKPKSTASTLTNYAVHQ